MSSKQITRECVLNKRDSLDKQQRSYKGSLIVKNVLALPEYVSAQTIMIYLGFNSEVPTLDLAARILNSGKRLVVPLCHEDNIIPCIVTDLEQDISPGKWGIPEPRRDRICTLPPVEIDLVIVPGVAFDLQGNRLGYGKGYYDRFLPQLREGVLTVGLGFSCQIVEEMETDEYDYKITLLITENSVIYAG